MHYVFKSAFIVAFCLANATYADPNEDLAAALNAKKFNKAIRIFHSNTIDPNFVPKGENHPLYVLLVRTKQWYLVKQILKTPDKLSGVTDSLMGSILLRSILEGQIEVAHRVLDNFPNLNINGHAPGSKRTSLDFAAGKGMWDVVEKILRLHSSAKFEEETLVLAARDKKWEILDLLTQRCQFRGLSWKDPSGATALWWVAFHGNWELFERLIDRAQNRDFDAALETKAKTDESVLMMVWRAKQWPLIIKVLALRPDSNFKACSRVEKRDRYGSYVRTGYGPTLYQLLADAPSHVLKTVVLAHMARELIYGETLPRFLENPQGINQFLPAQTAALVAHFRTAGRSFPELRVIPRDVRVLLALAWLRESDPELRLVPDALLTRVWERFEQADEIAENRDAKFDAIEAAILDTLAPVATRTEAKRRAVLKARKIIRDVVRVHVDKGEFPFDLTSDIRQRIVNAILASHSSLAKLTLTSVATATRALADELAAEARAEAEAFKRARTGKREREEDDNFVDAQQEEEEGDLKRHAVMQEVPVATAEYPEPMEVDTVPAPKVNETEHGVVLPYTAQFGAFLSRTGSQD